MSEAEQLRAIINDQTATKKMRADAKRMLNDLLEQPVVAPDGSTPEEETLTWDDIAELGMTATVEAVGKARPVKYAVGVGASAGRIFDNASSAFLFSDIFYSTSGRSRVFDHEPSAQEVNAVLSAYAGQPLPPRESVEPQHSELNITPANAFARKEREAEKPAVIKPVDIFSREPQYTDTYRPPQWSKHE